MVNVSGVTEKDADQTEDYICSTCLEAADEP